MSAEGMPHSEPSFFARPLAWVTRLVLRFPLPVIVAGVALAFLSMVLAGSRLGFRTSRLDLLNPDCRHNRLWIDYIEEFGSQDDAVVVVEGENRDHVVPVLLEISRELAKEDRLFNSVFHGVDLTRIRSKGLYFLPIEDLRTIEPFLGKIRPVVEGDWAQLELSNMTDGMCRRLEQGSSPQVRYAIVTELDRLSRGLLVALSRPGYYQSPWPQMPHTMAVQTELGDEYLLTNQGHMGFVLLRLATDQDKDSFAHGTEAIDALRKLIATVRAKHPEVEIGLTGLPIMENDEMQASQTAMLEASLLSLFGVACLFVAGFGGLRHPLVTVGSLLLALAWSFGYITLTIGHLNILSIAFAVILIGLGIDFGIHYVARYLQLRKTIRRSDEALIETAAGVGPGITTGAITTAIAFFMAGFTTFVGVAELGLIAGGGILLCCLGTIVVLPAMIHLMDSKRKNEILPAPLDIHGWISPLFRQPLVVLIVTLVGTVMVGGGLKYLRYDHNLLNLQPEGLESVECEQRLLAKSDKSVWFALSIAETREELLRRKAKFLEKKSVDHVEEIVSFLPEGHEQKRPIIERIRGHLENLPERPPEIPVNSPADLGRVLGRAQMLLGSGSLDFQVRSRLEQIREILRSFTAQQCYRLLREYQHGIAGDLLSRLYRLRAMADPNPPELDDLPKSLVTRFVGQDGRHLLRIYSKGDIWDMDEMEKFVKDVRSVDPQATGNPLQTYEASRQMKASYEKAALLALVAITVVLLLDFCSFRDGFWAMPFNALAYTMLAMAPLGLGMLQTFGLMGLLDIPLNPANMIVLPLILGIGIDDGVHVIHDYRRQSGPYRMSASTASAVLITSLTTMIGFGSLMIASHRGLQSLGRVLTIGVSCCLFASLIMLPALLAWATRNRSDDGEEVADDEIVRCGFSHDGDHNELFGKRPVRRRQDSAHHPGTSRHALPKVGRRDQVDTRL
ncbi:MAG: MMPL family transporter [Pirellulales bacterium]|nr:MMPL family transporter [Pirellulales bacterium]